MAPATADASAVPLVSVRISSSTIWLTCEPVYVPQAVSTTASGGSAARPSSVIDAPAGPNEVVILTSAVETSPLTGRSRTVEVPAFGLETTSCAAEKVPVPVLPADESMSCHVRCCPGSGMSRPTELSRL